MRTLILIGSLIALAFGMTQMAQAGCVTQCYGNGNSQQCYTNCYGDWHHA